MNIVTLLEEIKALPNCKLHRPCGLPKLRPEHVLPEDLRIFYEHCGGFTWNQMVETTLWSSFSVLPPQQVSLANPLIAFVPQSARESCPDISWDWYVIAHNSDRDYFTSIFILRDWDVAMTASTKFMQVRVILRFLAFRSTSFSHVCCVASKVARQQTGIGKGT